MKQILKQIRVDFILTSLLSIVLGVAIMVWKESAMEAFVMFLAIITIIMGFAQIAGYILKPKDDKNAIVALALGIIITIVGVWALFQPQVVLSWISVIFAVLLIIHGVRSIKETFDLKKHGYELWWVALLLSLATLVLGILLVLNKMLVWNWLAIVIGLALVFSGISNLWLISRANKVDKDIAKKDKIIDVEVSETDNQ